MPTQEDRDVAAAPAASIRLSNVCKTFRSADRDSDGDVQVLDDINLDVRGGEFVMILGPSGCGKTTLLRAIAGLLPIDAGEMWAAGKQITGPGPDRAMVFQSFALLPWRNVLANAAFGLELAGVKRAEREAVAKRYIDMVGLTGFERRLPKELSGGMQQRVGLARALAVDPSILLLDEPFGALDEQTRRVLQEELLGVWERQSKTTVFITHSIDEALFLGDRIVLMSARPGRIQRIIDNPLARPRTRESEALPEYVALKQELWNELRPMIGQGEGA